MRYGFAGSIVLVAVLSCSVLGQERQPHHYKLQRLGLGGMQVIHSPQPQVGQIENVYPEVIPSPAGATPAYFVPAPPVFYGRRQHYYHRHVLQRDNLKRQAWRIAHRSARF